MTRPEKLQQLALWAKRSQELDTQWEAFARGTGATADAPFGDAVWRMWDHYTQCVANRIDCSINDLLWYSLDNEYGKRGLECTIKTGETRKIRTLEDLIWMLGYEEAE